jgi:hypothetical protein
LLFAATSLPASAHHEKSNQSADPNGISIPSLLHGQMEVIANNLSAIRELAERQEPTDPVMRRLQGFMNTQSPRVFLGMVPEKSDR